MEESERSQKEMRDQLKFMVGVKESMKDLDDRIRGTSLFLALEELKERHTDIFQWEMNDRPDESLIIGKSDDRPEVIGRVRTMSLRGKSTLGGRQQDSMKRNLQDLESKEAEYKYMFLLDPWTVQVVADQFPGSPISILPLLKQDIAAVVRKSAGEAGISQMNSVSEPVQQMVEEVITKDADIPDERIIVSPISRTSIRQGFLYIPKDKGEMLEEGPVKVWIRKDASLESKCMISKTGGVRIGGGLTKWFRSIGIQPEDEMVLGILDEHSLLVLMIRRKTPYTGDKPTVETVKW